MFPALRDEYARLERSAVMKAVDEKPVRSVICFVVPTEHRGQGVAASPLKAAAYAKKLGLALDLEIDLSVESIRHPGQLLLASRVDA